MRIAITSILALWLAGSPAHGQEGDTSPAPAASQQPEAAPETAPDAFPDAGEPSPQPDAGIAPAQPATAPAPAAEPEPVSAPGYSSVVTARRPDQTEFNSTVGVNVIDQQRVEELQPRNTAEALRNQPGVFVQQTGFLGGAPILRGFIGNSVVYLFDGVRRNTASLYPGANNYLNNTDPFSVRRVEIIRGPGSVLYGSDAIGGVINVISALPLHFDDSGYRPFARVGLTMESADTGWMPGAQVGFTSPKVMANLSGSYLSAGDVRGGGSDGILTPSSFNQRALDGQVGVKLSSTDAVEALAQYFKRPDGMRFDSIFWKQDDEREMALVRYVGRLKGPFDSITASAYYHRQYGYIDNKYWDDESLDQTIGLELQARSHIGPINLTYGLHYHHDIMSDSDPQNFTQQPNVTWDNPAAFALAEWLLTSRVMLEGSLRGDYFIFDSTAPPAGASVPEGLSANDLALHRSDFALTGGLGAVVRLSESINWVVSGGTAFRAPNKNDYLSVGQFTLGYDVPPSGTLKPERSFSVETGLRTNHARIVGSLSLFYTYIQDLIISTPSSFDGSDTIDVGGQALRVYSPKNVDTAQAAGAEASVRFWVTDQLSAYGNGSWMWGQRSDGEPLDYAYPANGTLGLRFQDRRDGARYFAEAEVFGVMAFGRIPSNVKTDDPAYWANPQDATQGTILVDGKLPGFALINLRAGARIAEPLELVVDLDNLTNRKYRMKDSRIDGPGFNARIGLTVRY